MAVTKLKALVIRIAVLIAILASLATMVSCAQNAPWRTADPVRCPQSDDCGKSFLETHENYTLGFIEFSDRGNDFDRSRTDQVLHTLTERSADEEGIAIITFVHGWLHNASEKDHNVQSFQRLLDIIGSSGALGERELFGVYVGWRGKSLYGLKSQFLTYWNRKATAQHVGYNGVSPLIQQLSDIDQLNEKNLFVLVGHSFGGAMTLSAVDDVLLSRMIGGLARNEAPKPIGEGIILINPAVEANQILALKEQSGRFSEQGLESQKLLHVISSEADRATHVFFPIGQTLSTMTWKETEFTRYYRDLPYQFSENDLDTTTAGNYQRFWTQSLSLRDASDTTSADANGVYPAHRWEFTDLCLQDHGDHNRYTSALPCSDDDPITLTITDKNFIKGHSDIFNENVSAYLATVIASHIHQESESMTAGCSRNGHFTFERCFQYFLDHFSP